MLWLATYNGVSTFNGTAFANYNTGNSGIASNAILKVQIDGLGRKWFASQFNGIILYNGTAWTNYTTSNSGLPGNEIHDIAVDGQNNLWIATDSGLTKFNGTTWTTYNSVTNLNSVATDSNNGVWVTNGGVLYKFNGTDFNFIAQGTDRILRIANNTVYVKGFDSLITLTTSGTNITFTYQNNSCLAGSNPNALDVDSNSKVWIGFNGAGLENFTDCTTYTKANTNQGLPDDYFSAVKTQSSGIIWLGTLQLGLVKMAPGTAVCNPPTQMYTSNITSSTATLNWLPSTSIPNGGYYYVYSTSPTMTGSGTAAASTTANISNLQPNTTYYGWVTANCVSSQSTWVSGGSFTTLPGAVTGCWQSISAGSTHSLGIKTDGTLWAWGNNGYGQLGDGTNISRFVPKQIGLNSTWKKIAAGEYFSVGIKTDGTIWTWGNNLLGQLGDGSNNDRNMMLQIGTDTNWENITAGLNHVLAIKTNGTLWAWGNNSGRQLGDGTNITRYVPTPIGAATDWQKISAGAGFSLAIKANGTLWAWGGNGFSQLGDGTTTTRTVPTQIGTDTTWENVAAGREHSLALKAGSLLYAWGSNSVGQLGDGTNMDRSIPTLVFQGVQKIDAGRNTSMIINTLGQMLACGENTFGQLGDGTTTHKNSFVLIGNANDHHLISAGGDFSFSINTSGVLKACGANDQGYLGIGSTANKVTLTPLACPTSSLAVDEISSTSDNLKVFPNPVQDILYISSDQKITSVAVYSGAGQQILTKSIDEKRGSVDASALPSGIYMVKVNAADNTVRTVKIIKR